MIYYSHVNEDNLVEKNWMDQNFFQNLICIVGSGERVLGIMGHGSLEQIFAVDSNIESLYLLELKLKALEKLSVENYLEFIGINPSKKRTITFDLLKKDLTSSSRFFWERRMHFIQKGIVYIGHFEQFLERFRPLYKCFLGKNFYQCFEKSTSDIENFPKGRWNLLKSIYSQKWAFKLGGSKDVAFISNDANQSIIPDGLQSVLDQNEVKKSFMFHLIFKGHLEDMKPEYLPPSLKFENLKKIKESLTNKRIKIHFQHEDILDFMLKKRTSLLGNTFYSFSDILSFGDFDFLVKLIQSIPRKGIQSGVFRSFIRNRISENQTQTLSKKMKKMEDLSHVESTKMYQVFGFEK